MKFLLGTVHLGRPQVLEIFDPSVGIFLLPMHIESFDSFLSGLE